MSPYTRRSIRSQLCCSQLCCLALALALLALPLAGITADPAPILKPLATQLVPLGTSLQSVPSRPFQVPSFVAPAKLVLGPLPSAAFAANADTDGRFQNITSDDVHDSDAVDNPHGRSPPSA
jgi:hypothetical protein